jgi:acetyl-CoA carboxylase carboxyltransferase component
VSLWLGAPEGTGRTFSHQGRPWGRYASRCYRERETEPELRAVASPFHTAEAFFVEDIVDPRETRPYLCRFIDAVQSSLRTKLWPKPKYGVRP